MSGLFSLVREVSGTFFPGKVPGNQLFELCGWTAFFICGIWAWWAEHARWKALEEDLQNTVPQLIVIVYEAILETDFGYNDLFIDAEIENVRLNAPSLVRSYKAEIEVDGGRRYWSSNPLHDLEEFQSVCVEDNDDGEDDYVPEWLHNQQTLTDLTATIDHEHPVEANLPHRGWLHFRIDMPAWSSYLDPTNEQNECSELFTPDEAILERIELVQNAPCAKFAIASITVPGGNSASSIKTIEYLSHRRIVKRKT